MFKFISYIKKAGEGNRTLTTSLEGWGSTIELHPHTVTSKTSLSNWGKQDSNLRRRSHQIYSLTPLAAREFPPNQPKLESISQLLHYLYIKKHRSSKAKELAVGIEPTTFGLQNRCSAN